MSKPPMQVLDWLGIPEKKKKTWEVNPLAVGCVEIGSKGNWKTLTSIGSKFLPNAVVFSGSASLKWNHDLWTILATESIVQANLGQFLMTLHFM